MADRPLRPATDHCLGGLLPRQLANRPQAPPEAPEFLPVYFPVSSYYAVLAAISSCYPPLQGRSPTYYSPVRHFQGYCYPLTFDLHVLGTPPALVLSQDQTLRQMVLLRFLRAIYLWSRLRPNITFSSIKKLKFIDLPLRFRTNGVACPPPVQVRRVRRPITFAGYSTSSN